MKHSKITNTLKLARPKTGRKTFPNSIALTLEQIEFLHTIPNASELIRSILDDIIKNQEDIEKNLPILSIKHQIDALEKQYVNARKEREDYFSKHDRELFQDGMVDQPLDTPEANYHRKIIDTLNDEMVSIGSRINKLKTQVMSNSQTDNRK